MPRTWCSRASLTAGARSPHDAFDHVAGHEGQSGQWHFRIDEPNGGRLVSCVPPSPVPTRHYHLIQPQVRALREKYAITYRQESVFRWFGRMLDVVVGRTSMRELEAFPPQG